MKRFRTLSCDLPDSLKHQFQKIRQGTLEEALSVFGSLFFKVEQFERLRRYAVSEEEIQSWNELRLTKYPELSKRKAARRIKSETGSFRSVETIRRHLGTGAIPTGNNVGITE